jgi:hypothetical protein
MYSKEPVRHCHAAKQESLFGRRHQTSPLAASLSNKHGLSTAKGDGEGGEGAAHAVMEVWKVASKCQSKCRLLFLLSRLSIQFL